MHFVFYYVNAKLENLKTLGVHTEGPWQSEPAGVLSGLPFLANYVNGKTAFKSPHIQHIFSISVLQSLATYRPTDSDISAIK